MSWLQVKDCILPFTAIQLYLFCLLYLMVARKRFAGSFCFLALFLGAMIFFLACYLVDILVEDISSPKLIQARMFILFSIGFPSLVIASSKLNQLCFSRKKVLCTYFLGVGLSCVYMLLFSLGWRTFFGADGRYAPTIFPNFHPSFVWGQVMAVTTALVLVVIPCSYQLIVTSYRDLKSKAFVSSAILFAVLFVIGILSKQWWLYYVGSIVSASIFLAAIYVDIHHLNQTASFIKDELRNQVLNGSNDTSGRVSELIESLEESSRGNLEVYKMRIREVLSMIADDAIESGGDVELLLKRNQENWSKIDQAEDLKALSDVTENETQELSEIIVNIPHQRRAQVIREVKEYVASHLDQDLKVNGIAEVFHVSKSYLTNGFKEIESETLNQYITRLRIEKAKGLLKRQTVTETAFDVGFSNSNYFSTVFKKITGKTPKEYQNYLKSGV
ncbi:helix-turn-helix domain-containing protein [Rubritalea spongiae]|uniref:Helix-turn-helix domain-containing protein n=2 Tax=Rubritalea spongiae TaxID=430797 RepID=A0ABW5E367_9BACT